MADKETLHITETPEETKVSTHVAKILGLDPNKDVWAKSTPIGGSTELYFSDAALAKKPLRQVSNVLSIQLGANILREDAHARYVKVEKPVGEIARYL